MSTKRYNLVLPLDQYDKVKQVADDRGITIAELLRKFIVLGLTIEAPDTTLVIKNGDTERELILL